MWAIKTIIITLLCEPLPPGDDLKNRRAIYYLSEHHFRAVVYIVIFLSFVFYRPRVFTFFVPIKRIYPPYRFSASSITELGQILYSYLGTYNNNMLEQKLKMFTITNTYIIFCYNIFGVNENHLLLVWIPLLIQNDSRLMDPSDKLLL